MCSLTRFGCLGQLQRPMSTAKQEIIVEKVNHVGQMTLNRPKELNALNLPIVKAIRSTLQDWQHDDDVAMVLLKAAGSLAFCAGADIKSIREHCARGDERAALEVFKNGYCLINEYSKYRKPFVTLMNGLTMGSGKQPL